MGRRRDAVLALLVLVPAAAGLLLLAPPVRPEVVALGVGGTLVLEAASLAAGGRVRAVWDRPRVQFAAVGGTLVVAVAAATLFGPGVLVALVAGLLTYLGLLGAAELRDRTPRVGDS